MPDLFTWDTAKYMLPGMFETVITDDLIQPKLKHWYRGEFPGYLSGLNWRIKTMDRPKVDIESVEQLRGNIKRNYPVKYNFGDLSVTFWDDIDHITITTLNNYFQGNVLAHGGSKQGPGAFLIRDSIVIPYFKIYEYSVGDRELTPIVFTFYNAVLASLDFDSSDDDGDEAIHTIQMVLKIEGYNLDKQ